MSEEIIKVFDYLGEKFGIVIDWTQESILPYLKELLGRIVEYNIAMNIVGMIFGLLGIIGGIVWVKFFFKQRKNFCETGKDNYIYFNGEYGGEMTFQGIIFSIVLSVLSFTSALIFIENIVDTIGWIFIPEIKLIEYLKILLSTI